MSKLSGSIKSILGVREVLMIIGLGLVAYGLYLFVPWVSYSVTGCFLMAGGFFLRDE